MPLEDAELERISNFVAGMVGTEVVITAQVDESVLGGLIVQIGDRLLDGSAASSLDRMRHTVRTAVA